MDEDIYKKIEAYLGGDMTSEEQKQFELMMSKDIELQKAVKLSNEINHHLHEESWLSLEKSENKQAKNDIEDYIKSNEANEIKSKISLAGKRYKKSQYGLRRRLLIVSIAGVFVITLVSTVFFNQNSSTTNLYSKYYTENDLPSIVKRGSQNELLNKGIIAFKARKYEKAITFFEDYLKENNDPLLYSYIGISYLELDKTKEALSSFDKLLYSSSLDKSKALWYKSLLYLKMNDTVELKKTLSNIISDSTNFNYNKAKELLLVGD
ncbi:hypothetical protein [uncultured Aquimarina sp.]|uniref:tetratricopeptide repeat protein n=1 Tax=uncultured Aquimarina sp. TaxID=575652 RepID=UPI0026298CB1|nr:hypothetical protein [uncultured Aquimarina sp.]